MYDLSMTQMTVADFKSKFSEVISHVSQGESVQILYGRSKRPVAVLTADYQGIGVSKRVIGTFDGVATFSEIDDGKITEEEFIGL